MGRPKKCTKGMAPSFLQLQQRHGHQAFLWVLACMGFNVVTKAGPCRYWITLISCVECCSKRIRTKIKCNCGSWCGNYLGVLWEVLEYWNTLGTGWRASKCIRQLYTKREPIKPVLWHFIWCKANCMCIFVRGTRIIVWNDVCWLG
jgi:hypothetical protein